ncbi:MFS transporter [Pseudoxanthomonas sp. CF125]|uniref:MFS transporter n=1 Tax=Pseudoxanthomonas sp. CF125 TaxID=1855303 RepID=UPI000881AAA6|nr:MFS transporter [Pseudoxanthomonas sp. CF125]SDR04471.1 Fucose permease [Pseudoxanthomonas sp. CF125]
MNPQRLFVASCIALLATAMSFAIRGDIMGELELAFGLDKIQLGWISGAAFWGFGLSILFGGTLCDLLGMGRLLKLAAVGHIAGVLLTVFATDFTMLFAATVVIGIANGFVEAGINPLIATLYREDKTARLVKLHAWFPGGIVIGGVLAFAFTQLGLGWQSKMLLMLVPSAIYAAMFFAQRFPDSERKAAGVSTAAMYGELKRPLFLVVFVCMWLTAATELGPGQWVSNIFNEVMHSTLQAGVLLLVWINGIMYALRQFGGVLAHRLSPVTLIAVTAPIAALGLWLFGRADTPVLAFAAAALLAVGTAFWWPTMLGLTSERFPRGGALALAMVGAAGAFSTAVAGPVMGWINNNYGATNVLPVWAVLPVLIALIFGILHLVDRARGGYRIERVGA